jgi:Fe2+ or Zn2+ uptake regulation protein
MRTDAVRRFGDLEAAIMDVMWAADDRLPVREVVGRLRPERELAFNTVQTVMDILFRKGWVDRELQRRAYRWAEPGPCADNAIKFHRHLGRTTPSRLQSIQLAPRKWRRLAGDGPPMRCVALAAVPVNRSNSVGR